MPVDAHLVDRIARVAESSELHGIVQVVAGDGARWELVRGLADRSRDVPLRRDTVLGIASGTKTVTALTVLSLVDAGALTLDTAVRPLVGAELPALDGAVTVEHLLAHTSGLADYLDESAGVDVETVELSVPPAELLETEDYLPMLRDLPMRRAPGAAFEYCNAGYVVLAWLVERVCERPFRDVVQERVLDPAGMESSGFWRSDALPARAALGWIERDGAWRDSRAVLPNRGSGDGGLLSTVDDLHALWQALLDGRLLPPALVARMTSPASEGTPTHDYGLGLWLTDGGLEIEGMDAGVSCWSRRERRTGAIATVLSNTTRGAWPIVRAITEPG